MTVHYLKTNNPAEQERYERRQEEVERHYATALAAEYGIPLEDARLLYRHRECQQTGCPSCYALTPPQILFCEALEKQLAKKNAQGVIGGFARPAPGAPQPAPAPAPTPPAPLAYVQIARDPIPKRE